MTGALPRWAGVALMMAIAVVFGSNHVAARIPVARAASAGMMRHWLDAFSPKFALLGRGLSK